MFGGPWMAVVFRVNNNFLIAVASVEIEPLEFANSYGFHQKKFKVESFFNVRFTTERCHQLFIESPDLFFCWSYQILKLYFFQILNIVFVHFVILSQLFFCSLILFCRSSVVQNNFALEK